ncbi:MAG: T9SS C-terminal target domain-containing protein [Calditrichaeota bacterium]|nr:MAG: T9SS C-terminal target domain-containing protein [Calditrichota bacterium]
MKSLKILLTAIFLMASQIANSTEIFELKPANNDFEIQVKPARSEGFAEIEITFNRYEIENLRGKLESVKIGTSENLLQDAFGTKFIAVPERGKIELEVLSQRFEETDFTLSKIESQNLVSVTEPKILKDFRLVNLAVNPIKVENGKVSLLKDLKVRLKSDFSAKGQNEKLHKSSNYSLAFKNLYENNILNFDEVTLGMEPERGRFLFISNDTNFSQLFQLIDLKQRQGFEVIATSFSQIPTPFPTQSFDSINDYISQVYNASSKPLEYVMLVGDVANTTLPPSEAMPSFFFNGQIGQGVSDHAFALHEGDDYFPDLLIGRLPVQDVGQLTLMTIKNMVYQANLNLSSTDWYKRAVVVAGNEQAVTPVINSQWVKNELLTKGNFTEVVELYDYKDGSTPPSPVQIGNLLSQGQGLVNYRGWASFSGWIYPQFTTNNVLGLGNIDKLSVVTSVVCGTGNFQVEDSFGEAWLQAGSPQIPTGGVAFWGASHSDLHTKWLNPLSVGFYDGLLNQGLETFGELTVNAKLLQYQQFPNDVALDSTLSNVRGYAYLFNILGDPSLSVWSDAPQPMNVSYDLGPSVLENTFEVTVTDGNGNPLEEVLVSIFKENEILDNEFTNSNGKAFLQTDGATTGVVQVTAMKHNFVPHLGVADFINFPIELVVDSVWVTDGNDDIAFPNEEMTLNFAIRNDTFLDLQIGFEVNSKDVFGEVTQGVENFTLQGATSTIVTKTVKAESFAPDGRVLDFLAEFSYNGEILKEKVSVEVKAPVFKIQWFDSISALYFYPGAGAQYQIVLENLGSVASGDFDLFLETPTNLVTIQPQNLQFLSIPSGQSGGNTGQFAMTVSQDMAWGTRVPFTMTLTQPNGFSQKLHTELVAGIYIDSTNYVSSDEFGYFGYDSEDSTEIEKPTFTWQEINPNLGGNGTNLNLSDDDLVKVALPWNFKFYGTDYDSLTICTNGWASFENPLDASFRNWGIPYAANPEALLAPFWDDLKPEVSQANAGVFTFYDQTQDAFIIEWSLLKHAPVSTTNPTAIPLTDPNFEETFQLVLYGQNSNQTATSGNGEIAFFYQNIKDIDPNNNWSTVGISNLDGTDGVQYSFSNSVALGGTKLKNGLAVKFSTDVPESYIPTSVEEENSVPQGFNLSQNFPNPFNPTTVINYELEITNYENAKLVIFNVLGEKVKEFVLDKAKGSVVWNGTNSFGKSVASGVYFYRLEAGNFIDTKKMLFLK